MKVEEELARCGLTISDIDLSLRRVRGTFEERILAVAQRLSLPHELIREAAKRTPKQT